jgi:hypothetical protein
MNPRLFSKRVLLLVGACLSIGLLAGCGPQALATGTVSGKVTLQGQPLSAGVVLFTNAKAGTGASAALDASGNYQLETPLVTGPYDVAIQPPPAPPPHEMSKPVPKSQIPDKFRDARTSGLKTTVNPGKNTADFTL